MDISKWGFQNRNLVYFLVAVLLAGGALACYQMSKLEDPEIKVKLAMVATTYPGASAHQVELEVTDVLEKSIRKMDNVDNVESYSFNDLSLIQVELLTTVKDDDVEQHWDLLRRKVNDASALLPSGANTPIVQDDFGKVFGMFYALTGDGLSDREMADYAELIKREVIEIEGVDRVDIYGERSECINISLLQDRMANLGVKPAEVLATLNGQNKTTYTGYYENGENRIRVTVNDKFKTVEDIGKMLIQGHDDDQLRLSDIARIEKAYENPTRNEMFYDHERALGILIAASSGSDIIKVGHAVESKLEELKAERLPAGVECHKIFYQPERVGSSLGTFVINLIESVIIVVLILMIAMGPPGAFLFRYLFRKGKPWYTENSNSEFMEVLHDGIRSRRRKTSGPEKDLRKRKMRIRKAKEKDIPRLLALLGQVLQIHAEIRPDVFISGTTKYTARELAELLKQEDRPIYVAVNEDDVCVGYAFCQMQEQPFSTNMVPFKSLFIDDLCVDQQARGQHIGESLFEYVKQQAKEQGCYEVTLNVWAGNTSAEHFYEKMGMKTKERQMEYIL
mgnify:CR=1 FL=1